MKPYIFIKNSGETMNQAISRFKNIYKINNKICYCGRLDPMARGIILLLVGDDCIYLDLYCKLNKQYRFEILFGISTDTNDMMGIINKYDNNININIDMIKKYITIGKFNQKIHNFSAKKYKGKSLWYYTLNDISYPPMDHSVEIFKVEYENVKKYNFKEFIEKVINDIDSIDKKNNFRQEEIISQYKKLDIDMVYTLPITIDVSSGFYIRQLVADIMDYINFPITTFDINRKNIYYYNGVYK
jgi:tRNA pseudouridine(55) synthase